MRSLNKNQTQLWYVRPNGFIDVLDSDGYKTGEKEYVYTVPQEIKLTLSPVSGIVILDSGGKFLELDYTATSTEVALSENDLIFDTLPIDNFDKTYTFLVKTVLKSLNSFQYLLEKRF